MEFWNMSITESASATALQHMSKIGDEQTNELRNYCDDGNIRSSDDENDFENPFLKYSTQQRAL